MKCISITVYGKVQGVWYRASTRDKALELGLTGTVENQKDGAVYIEAQGTDEVLQTFVDWCQQGPPHAKVSHLEEKIIASKKFNSFVVIR